MTSFSKRGFYEQLTRRLADEYEPRIMRFLQRIKEILLDEGYSLVDGFPCDMTCEEYCWALAMRTADGEPIDISVSIPEQRDYEGGEDYGMNFRVQILADEGTIIGELTPYNYAKDIWVDARNPDAVAARWQLIEQADITTIPNLLREAHV